MTYTVKKLAQLSGVSIRTLHFYDEIGLLKPAYYGKNNYRYYETEQLLMLQQILFYKEIGLPLNEIQKILSSDSFDKIESLLSHQKIITQNIEHNQNLLLTIDNTIAYLRGVKKMDHEDLYYGFDSDKQKQYEKELVKNGTVPKNIMERYQDKIQKWTQQDKANFLAEGKAIIQEMITAIEKNVKPTDNHAQSLVKRHHTWVGWNPSKEDYFGLTKMYQTPEFKKFYDTHHPELLAFTIEAMTLFAERELT